ncbi:poly-gamma-glutamate hydrolase family protein [Enhygromyxa salina]|uniref:poly-gamma-glutamate hydrolase family protein n=1 Tax=Enhygromyxa salina TaxID=215803 RepID=UPI0015E62877|nr:poly-gamma-glutamate hydrolase family protein [Enhygromyxa salina]
MKSQGLNSDKWMCSVSGEFAKKFKLGTQIRVRRNGSEYAVYTVGDVREDDPANLIRMGKIARERLGTSDSFEGRLMPTLALKPMTDDEAETYGEFVERVYDTKEHQGLVILAPHGGGIEFNTDLQARWVADALPDADLSTWCCSGWHNNGSDYTRWHVTSTKIHPASFPGLASIAERGFAYAVSFHGQKADGVLIGGGGPIELKETLRDEIKAVVGNHPVTIAEPGDHNSGMSAENVVNWMTAGGSGGIQLEQSPEIRDGYWIDVAEAVAKVYESLI